MRPLKGSRHSPHPGCSSVRHDNTALSSCRSGSLSGLLPSKEAALYNSGIQIPQSWCWCLPQFPEWCLSMETKKCGENKQTIHTNRSQGLSPEDHQDTPGSGSEILLSKLLLWEKGEKMLLTYCIYLSTYTHTRILAIHIHTDICTYKQIFVLYIN